MIIYRCHFPTFACSIEGGGHCFRLPTSNSHFQKSIWKAFWVGVFPIGSTIPIQENPGCPVSVAWILVRVLSIHVRAPLRIDHDPTLPTDTGQPRVRTHESNRRSRATLNDQRTANPTLHGLRFKSDRGWRNGRSTGPMHQ